MPSYLLQPTRGKVDPTTLKPNPLSDKPQTQFIQVEHAHDPNLGLRLHRYTYAYEFDYTAIPTCTATGGVSAGAGATVRLDVIPANVRVCNVWAEVVTAFVNDATTQDIDGVYLNTTAVIADAALAANTAGIVAAPTFTLTEGTPNTITQVLPALFAVNVTPIVYFAGANTVKYTAGKMRLYVEVLSYFE